MPDCWFAKCPTCAQEVFEIAKCDVPADVHAYPIVRDVPIDCVACLRCPSGHEWYVLVYTNDVRDVVYPRAEGGYTRLEERTVQGDPQRN
jgi:hypothetical protein